MLQQLRVASLNAELQSLEVGHADLHDTGNPAEDENKLEALACRVGTIPAGTKTHHRTDRGTRPRASLSTERGHGVARIYIRTATFLSLFSRFPDARRCFLLLPARMAHCATMGSFTRGFGRPGVVDFLSRKVVT